MNIRKVFLSKVLPAILIAALVFHFSVSSTYAMIIPDVEETLDYFRDNLILFVDSDTSAVDSALSNVTADSSAVLSWYADSSRTTLCLLISEKGLIAFLNGTWYLSEVNSHLYFGYFDTFGTVPYSYGISVSTGAIQHLGYTFYPVRDISTTFYTYSSYSLYYSNYFYFDGSDYGSPNLTLGSYYPDTRYLAADLVDRFGSTYIAVTVNDNISDDWDGSYSFVTVTGNSIGIPFTYTFGFREYLEKQGDPPYAYFLLDPSSIPYDVFTLSSLEYVSSGSFGSLSISVNFSFGDSPIEYNPINNNYFWSNTSVTEYNGGSAWGFDYLKVDTVDGDFWDDNKVLIQPFSFSVMAIPVMPSGITSMDYYVELVNDYLSYYDVILTEVPETTFDNLYGAGAFADFQSSVSWVHYGNFLMDVSEWYASHDMIAHPLSYEYFDNLPLYNSSQYCGIAFSDHFYFKQLSYMLGDTSDILTEFSSRFFEEDGFSQTLLVSLSNIYDTEKSFFDNAWYYLERQNYFINDLILNKYIPDSVDLLKDIKELLGDILNALGENAPIDLNDLESPLIDIYRFVESFYEVSKSSINELRIALTGASTGMLPGPSGTPVYLLPTSEPTPIPLPTLPSVPLLP